VSGPQATQGGDVPFLVVIAGPTGIGKTGLALRLASRLGGEIVGADSMQVYRGMDIGTGKVTAEERAAVPHHLIDVVDPDETFHARRYQQLADAAISALHARERRVFVVGGTGLYIRILLRGLFEAPEPDPELRATYERRANELGLAALHDRLKLVDPETAGRVPMQDRVRVVRALEVFDLTGVPLSRHQREHAFAQRRYSSLLLGLRMDRAALYARIDARVEEMLDEGFVEEVRRLVAAGYARAPGFSAAIGYAHVAASLRGELPLDEAIRLMKRDTRRYAKRQLTWFAREPGLEWVDAPFDVDALEARVRESLPA